MQEESKEFLWKQCCIAAFLCLCGVLPLARVNARDVEMAIPTSQLMRAINVATATTAGKIAKVEVERKNGQAIVEVKIWANDSKHYEASVQADSGKLLSIDADEDDD